MEKIGNKEDLVSFRNRVNSGEDFKDTEIILLANINNLEDWTPIGTMEHPFRGVFHGQNCTISNISVHSDSVAGVFGCIENGIVEYLHVEGGKIIGNKAGGICGHIRFNGLIDHCTNSADVKGLGENAYAGGICGDSWGGTLRSCTNKGNIGNESSSVSALTGGIAGASYQGVIKECSNGGKLHPVGGHCGGVCASNNEGTISECDSKCAPTSGRNMGGICGWNNGKIERCTAVASDLPIIGEGKPAIS